METGAVSDAVDQLGRPNGTVQGLIRVANSAAALTGTVRTATVVDSDEPVVCGGWVRDAAQVRATGLTVWARGASPHSGKGRVPAGHREAVLGLAADPLCRDDMFREVPAGNGSSAGGVDVSGTR